MNPSPMQADEYTKMANAESTHWWYKATHRAVQQYMLAESGSPEWIDGGAGTGGFLTFMRAARGWEGKGFELVEDGINHCRSQNLTVTSGDLNKPETWPQGSWDYFTAIDTFYFVLGDERKTDILEAIWDRLAPGGCLILHMPSLPAFAGTHDLRVGITERVTKPQAMAWFKSRPWVIQQARYRLFLLSPLVALNRAISRRKWAAAQVNGKTMPEESDVGEVNPLLNCLFYVITRFEDWIGLPAPWGSSLLLVARKPKN
jgi:hypothetical protein